MAKKLIVPHYSAFYFSALAALVVSCTGLSTQSSGNVIYDKNGATSGEAPFDLTLYRAGETISIRGNTGHLEKYGTSFAGWTAGTSSLAPIYSGGSQFKMDVPKVTLYAAWIPSTFEFWNADGKIGILKCAKKPEGQLSIPPLVSEIGDTAFSACNKLTDVVIPSSVTSLGSCSFYFCTGLTSVTIPSSVRSIGSCAFYFCRGLTSVTIPPSVVSIESCVFNGCTGLTSVTIPSSVRSIKRYAFYGCASLSSVTEQAMTPPSLPPRSGAFSNAAPNLKIHVPSSSDGSVLASYKAAKGWNEYASAIVSP
jgi:hypothetical protein